MGNSYSEKVDDRKNYIQQSKNRLMEKDSSLLDSSASLEYRKDRKSRWKLTVDTGTHLFLKQVSARMLWLAHIYILQFLLFSIASLTLTTVLRDT